MEDFINKNDCSDIYKKEIDNSLMVMRKFREAWLHSPYGCNTELFQYADIDFYFYRFAIDRQERSTELFMNRVLYQVMERYGIDFEVPENMNNAPFSFIICKNEERIAYRFDDFCSDEDINAIILSCNADRAFIIRTWKHGNSDEWIKRKNHNYSDDGVNLRSIVLEDFFVEYFGRREWILFLSYVEEYIKAVRDITGYTSIKFLSAMNLSFQKALEERILLDWEYKDYKYQIIDDSKIKIKSYLYLSGDIFDETDLAIMVDNFIKNSRYKALVGKSEYAESFITSEWLYHSLKERSNFDYTAIISGYLKSIEQLLYTIVMINMDNNCKISMSGIKDIRSKANKRGVKAYAKVENGWKEIKKYKDERYPYIDLISTQAEYMDRSIGTFEYFLRYNPQIFYNTDLASAIADMVCCFRIECRNGYFHTHNLKDWDIVEKTRNNAIYLYFVLLGECLIPTSKIENLCISKNDKFNELCMKICEFKHYSPEFIFENAAGEKQKMIFDSVNNIPEYTDDGEKYFSKLIFYKVDDFTVEEYEKIDEGVKDEQKVYLTRDYIPCKVYGVYRNHELEEIVI